MNVVYAFVYLLTISRVFINNILIYILYFQVHQFKSCKGNSNIKVSKSRSLEVLTGKFIIISKKDCKHIIEMYKLQDPPNLFKKLKRLLFDFIRYIFRLNIENYKILIWLLFPSLLSFSQDSLLKSPICNLFFSSFGFLIVRKGNKVIHMIFVPFIFA